MRRPPCIHRGDDRPGMSRVIWVRAVPDEVTVKNSVRILLSLMFGKPTL